MLNYFYKLQVFILAAISLSGHMPLLHAEVLPAFFNQNGARTVFEGPIASTKSKAPLMLVPKVQPEKKKEAEKEEAEKTKTSEEFAKETALAKDRRINQPKDREGIVKEYGDPNQPYPMGAIEDAPLPFRGLIAALNQGDEELAFKYAVQYTRYQQNLQSGVNKALNFMEQARIKEGLESEDINKIDPSKAQYAYLQDIEKSAINNESATEKKMSVYVQARELMKAIKTKDFNLFEDAKKEVLEDLHGIEEQARADTRRELAGKLPISRNERIDIYFFYKNDTPNLEEAALVIDKLYQSYVNDTSVNVVAFLASDSTQDALVHIRSVYNVSYPTLPGAVLSQKLGLTKLPLVVFSTPSGKSHIEKDISNHYRLDEIVKIMKGS